MPWNGDRASAQRAPLLSCHLRRPRPRRLMVAVSLTPVRTVLPTFPRQHTPAWQAWQRLAAWSGTWSRHARRGGGATPPLAPWTAIPHHSRVIE